MASSMTRLTAHDGMRFSTAAKKMDAATMQMRNECGLTYRAMRRKVTASTAGRSFGSMRVFAAAFTAAPKCNARAATDDAPSGACHSSDTVLTSERLHREDVCRCAG